jgi:heptosyltransferase-1
MSDILFIKTSSLGDVIHHMPAISEARRHFRDARFSWVVEESFAPLVRLHPAVDEVIPVASRRWRRELLAGSTWSDIRGFVRALRWHGYDEVIDTQGLLRTAVMARLARGRRHGYDTASIRERLACPFYDVRHSVSRKLHAIERNRRLTALALDYAPEGAIDFGLDRARLARASLGRYAVLLHATAQPGKQWAETHWIALGRALDDRGLQLLLPWGTPSERARSERIAAQVASAGVPDLRPLDEVARLIAGAECVIGVDTGLLHLAAALGVPLVGVFVGSEPGLTGPMGCGPIAIVGGKGAMPEPPSVIDALRGLS